MARGSVRDFVEVCSRNWRALGLGLLAGLFGGAVLDAMSAPVYRAEARLELPATSLAEASVELAFLADAGLRGTVLAHVARGLEAADPTSSRLSFPSSLFRIVGLAAAEEAGSEPDFAAKVSELRGSLDVSANGEARTLTVHFDDHRPEHAASVANAIAGAIIAYQAADGEKRQIEAERQRLEIDYADLLPAIASDHPDMLALRIQIANAERALFTLDRHFVAAEKQVLHDASLRLADPASPAATRRIDKNSNLLPSVLIALSIAGIGIARREMGAPPAATAGEIGAALGLPVLLEARLAGALPGTPPHLFVSGPDAEQGATFARRLADRLAADGMRTLLIDGDLGEPRLHASYEVANTRGLTSLMTGSVTRASFPHLFARVGRNLWLLPTGPGLVGTQTQGQRSIESVYALLQKSFDRVVVVAPLPGPDTGASVWPERARTILVLSADESWRENGTRALGQLARQGTAVVSVALAPGVVAQSMPTLGQSIFNYRPSAVATATPYDWRPRRSIRTRLARAVRARMIGTTRSNRQS